MKTSLCAMSALVLSLLASSASAAVIFKETFSYPDGDFFGQTPAVGEVWTKSTTGTTVKIVNGAAQSAHVSSTLSFRSHAYSKFGSSVTIGSRDTIYTGLDFRGVTVSSSATQTQTSTFFNLTSNVDGFTNAGRLFYLAKDTTAAGDFRLGIANGGAAAAGDGDAKTVNLTLGKTYRLITSYVVETGVNSLKVYDGETLVDSITATDPILTATPVIPGGVGIMQSLGSTSVVGMTAVDNVAVGTSFAEVQFVPEPGALAGVGVVVMALGRRRRG